MLTPVAMVRDGPTTEPEGWEVVIIGDGTYRVEVVDQPDTASTAWAHPGICMTPSGTTMWTAPDGNTIRSLTIEGDVTSRTVDAIECHGLAADDEGGLWIADPGRKASADGAEVQRRIEPGRVIRVDPSSMLSHEITDPIGDGWRPSGIALHNFGATGDRRVWVADGYGANRVHCFTPDGNLLWSSDGRDSGTAFQTPHGIIVDDRGPHPRLLVADRGNARIVSMTLEGEYLDTIGAEALTSPSSFAIHEKSLWVTELFGGVKVFDSDDACTGSFGDAPNPIDPIWPNSVVDGRLAGPDVPNAQLRAPHGIAATATGEIFITEWVIGGRVVRLAPVG